MEVKEYTLEEITNVIVNSDSLEGLRSFAVSAISALQEEVLRTKETVEDFRKVYGYNKKNQLLNVFVDPVVNNEILHLKKIINKKSIELQEAKDALEGQKIDFSGAVGKNLLEKVRMLKLENEELSKIIIESQVQPLTFEVNKEKEKNKILEKELKSLLQMNIQINKDNNEMSAKISQLTAEIADLKKENDSLLKKLDRHREPSKSRRSRSRGSPSPSRKRKSRRDSADPAPRLDPRHPESGMDKGSKRRDGSRERKSRRL
ncbi:conserved hypothetical protein [Theileria equi strain WA]|uniref:Uncharacterized protein n=1 Tax=Theileria equi strain WA TaxID=1537102 RepID=L1LA29_THEEQ|nr:conserved hypothetical protein [Theileria equi strain WA]EKX72104.1 conserved hypothetical protein [Theileria equi strain WA]|eukprot:XP_004831556.1 conserved hypothetical protein [Theileria equi strain WA]